MVVSYSSNNSGGYWWLSDEHWERLEENGWWIEWGGVYFCKSTGWKAPAGKPEPCGDEDKCHGHRKFDSIEECLADQNGRWLGAVAKYASKDFPSMKDAIQEWEDITGLEATDDGCNCCGPPHCFSSDTEYYSGEEILTVLYGSNPSKRSLLSRQTRDD